MSSSVVCHSQVQRFCREVQQLELHYTIPSGPLIRDGFCQQYIYDRLFSAKAKYPLPARYKLKVLKELVEAIEESIDDWHQHQARTDPVTLQEISDSLMGSLSELMASSLPAEEVAAQQKSYVTYHLSLLEGVRAGNHCPVITLLESRSLISASGTTGQRTWEAAFHLGEHLSLNPSIVEGKRVLELGSGTGYLAILCAKYLDAAHVIASDGSDEVLSSLPANLNLNALQGSQRIAVMNLKWGHALVGTGEADWNGGGKLDVVIGADITYDERVIPLLLATLVELFDMFPSLNVWISATARNKRTYDMFTQACKQAESLIFREVTSVIPDRGNGPFYDKSTPIHICHIKPNAPGGRRRYVEGIPRRTASYSVYRPTSQS